MGQHSGQGRIEKRRILVSVQYLDAKATNVPGHSPRNSEIPSGSAVQRDNLGIQAFQLFAQSPNAVQAKNGRPNSPAQALDDLQNEHLRAGHLQAVEHEADTNRRSGGHAK
jgi:hypothetical protein